MRLSASHFLIILLLPVVLAASEPDALNLHLDPHWDHGGTSFWYRSQTAPERYVFLRVDAASGMRTPAFDHQRMAMALGEALAMAVDAQALPITTLEFPDANTVMLASHGRWWKGTKPDLKLVPIEPPSRPWETDERPTLHTGNRTTISITNRSQGPIKLYWIDSEGINRLYATIPTGATRRQATFAGHVWMVAGGDGANLGVCEAAEEPLAFTVNDTMEDLPDPDRSPDGRWKAVIQQHNLWLIAASGESIQLSNDGSDEDSYELPAIWSPDGSHLAIWRKRRGDNRTITLIESSPSDQLHPKVHTIPYAKPGDRVDERRPCLFRIADLRQIPVAGDLLANPWSCDDLVWREDSTSFSFLFNQRGHQVLRLLEVTLDGRVRSLIDEQSPTFIDYAGKLFLYRCTTRDDTIWMSERDGWNHLWRYDARSGKVRNQITRGAWAVRSVERVDEQAGLIWFTAGGIVPGQDPYQIHHARVAFDGTGLTVLTEGDGTHEVAWSPDRRWFIDTWSRVDEAPRHVLRDGTTGSAVLELEKADIAPLLGTGWRMPERFTAKGRDGTTDIWGVIWTPRDFNPAKRYAVVENIYAGPQSASVPKEFSVSCASRSMADAGNVVVAQIDGMGTSYRSKAFHDVCWKNLADAGFPDRILWWKAGAATRPWMDLTRVGVYGGSAGGQNALGALLWHPEFYGVAVADCGCHDNRMDKIWWNELWMGWPIGPHYAEQSNVTQAHRLKGRLMLIVGELDENVDPQSTHQVAHALEVAGKDFELVVVHGAGHGAAETPFGSRKRLEFLKRELGGPQ